LIHDVSLLLIVIDSGFEEEEKEPAKPAHEIE